MDEKDRKVMRDAKKREIGILPVIVWIIATFAVIFVIKAIIETPRDLGPNMVYLGKADYGCGILTFFFCDSPDSGSYYYFGTDMTSDTFKRLMSKAGFVYDPNNSGNSNDYLLLHFNPNKYSKEGAFIDYYDAHDPVFYDRSSNVYSIRTTKKYVIEMYDYNYSEIRQALQNAKLLGS